MRNLKIVLACLFCLSVSTTILAQDKEYTPVDFSLQLKNKHLWRGLQVTNSSLAAVDLKYTDRKGNFAAGVWGGSGFTGEYKEFDYYVSYSKNGFTIALWDIYNFANDPNNKLFDYNKKTTGHFIDLSVAYRFSGKVPLNLSWATIIYGCDRGTMNEKNRYSTYVQADYPVIRNKSVDLDLGLGGAFALKPEKGTADAHFYAKDPGIVSIIATASKKVQLGSYTLPVSVTSMWNPIRNEGNIQIALNIF